MSNVAGDSLYEVSYRSSWGAGDRPLGHVVVRRLDDHIVVAEVPAMTEEEARSLLARAESDVRGPVGVFEREWGIGSGVAADPGPDVIRHAGPARAERMPDPGERITRVDARVTVFPDPSEVFAADQPWLTRLLHPLVSIDLAALDEAWHGRVPLLSPVEPEDGLLGETGLHGDDAGVNWLTLRMEPDGRWRFLGDRRLFEIEHAEARGLTGPAALYAKAETEFAGSKARWEQLGTLVWGDETDPTRQREGWGTDIAIVDQFGGDPGYGNWTAYPPPPALTLDATDPVAPMLRLADGRPFRFVAATAGYPWRNHGADAILTFYEPETRTAALTFEWN